MLSEKQHAHPVGGNQRESLLGRQLIVENIPANIGWKELKDLMRRAGNVVRVNIMQSGRDDTSHAVVLFSNGKDAHAAIDMLNGHQWLDRKLHVKLDRSLCGVLKSPHEGSDEPSGPIKKSPVPVTAALSQLHETSSSLSLSASDEDKKTQIFICNLPYIVGWQDLKDLFREAGQVIRTDIKIDPKTGKSKGMGTVLYTNPRSAQVAVEMFDGFEWFGRKIDVREDKCHNEGAHSHPSTSKKVLDDHHEDITHSPPLGNVNLPPANALVGGEALSWADKVKLVSTNSVAVKHEEPILQKPLSPYNPKSRPTQIPKSMPRRQLVANLDILGPSLNMMDEMYTGFNRTQIATNSSSGNLPNSRNHNPVSASVPAPVHRVNIWNQQEDINGINEMSSSFGNAWNNSPSLSMLSNSASHFRTPLWPSTSPVQVKNSAISPPLGHTDKSVHPNRKPF
eukprot:Partr_v1_DN28791_c3_g1_i2_m61905 putative myelin expression factor 2